VEVNFQKFSGKAALFDTCQGGKSTANAILLAFKDPAS